MPLLVSLWPPRPSRRSRFSGICFAGGRTCCRAGGKTRRRGRRVARPCAGTNGSEGHRQLGISGLTESAMGLRDAGDTHDDAAIATPVTWAQVAEAWVRRDPWVAEV